MPTAELTSTRVPQETANRSRCPAAFHAIARWLLRALTDAAGAWALAAGAPPDLDNSAGDAERQGTRVRPE